MRRNIKDKLNEVMAPDDVKVEVRDMFGRKLGSVQLTGLVDSSDTVSFGEIS